MSPEVTVVIPVRNVEETIREQLEALSRQDFTGAWEVIVADNGSTDATRDAVSRSRDGLPSLRIVDASGRRGVNHARNQGARAALGEVVLFCDGDDIVDPSWVRNMHAALREDDAVGGSLERFGRPSASGEMRPFWRDRQFLPSPIGANCGVRLEVWRALGGFNEDYDGGARDEVEFFWRLQLAGYRLGEAPNAVVRYRMPEKHPLRKSYRSGRENVRLDKDFRTSGYPGPRVGALRGWGWILTRAPLVIFPARRERWLRALARHFGRAIGSIKYRHLLL
jgi:glycosyltransferase involved in cell wall biosynthesis